jgi:hypothetical protein
VLPTATHKYNHATEHDWWLSHQARAGVPGEATLNTSDASSANQQRHDGDRAFDSTTRSSTQQTIKGTE